MWDRCALIKCTQESNMNEEAAGSQKYFIALVKHGTVIFMVHLFLANVYKTKAVFSFKISFSLSINLLKRIFLLHHVFFHVLSKQWAHLLKKSHYLLLFFRECALRSIKLKNSGQWFNMPQNWISKELPLIIALLPKLHLLIIKTVCYSCNIDVHYYLVMI